MTVNVEHIHLRQDEEYPVEYVLTKIREYSKNGKVPNLPSRIDKYLEEILRLGNDIFGNMEDSKRKSRMRIELHKIDNAPSQKEGLLRQTWELRGISYESQSFKNS